MDREQLLRSRRAAVSGVEFDWILVDAQEHVALCCSSQDGDIPDLVLAIDEARHDEFRDTLAALARQLPVLGDARVERGGMGWDQETPALAQRGLYVFDCRTGSGPYHRVLVPTVPARFTNVQPLLGDFRDFVPAARVSFADTESFSLPDLLPCR
jgi:hypothetical protein